MLEAKEVNFAYRRGLPVLNDIACTIGDGEFVARLGHNGSGKTTLSRLFMALLHPRSGQVLVDGEDIVNYEPADLADKIGYVFQNPDLQILEDTVFDEVAYGPRAKKLTAETIKKLALNPRTLILDEITNGQDAIEKERMMQYLQTLNEEKGITIVLISHDMDVVRRYAKRAIVLKDGDLVYDGTPTELFGGAYAVEEWGLRRPTAAALAGSLGFTAATPEEFCRLLVRKGAED